jgi:hypothetical protein
MGTVGVPSQIGGALLFCLFFLEGGVLAEGGFGLSLSASTLSAFDQAINSTFAMYGGVGEPTHLGVCQRRMHELMQRQQIPTELTQLRALTDAELYRLALLSAIGGMSTEWQRDADSDLFLLDEHGRMLQAFTPNRVETDVMLCVISALLGVIAVYYLILIPGAGTNTNNNNNNNNATTTNPNHGNVDNNGNKTNTNGTTNANNSNVGIGNLLLGGNSVPNPHYPTNLMLNHTIGALMMAPSGN